MKKFLFYFSFLGFIMVSNMFLTSCGQTNSSTDSNSFSSSYSENKIDDEEVFNLLMQKRNTLSNISNYSKGFTSITSSEYTSDVCVLDDKTNYGELNSDGNKWTSESEKEEVKNTILKTYKDEFNYSYSYEETVAFDLKKEEGFQLNNEKNDGTSYSNNYLYTSEGDNYYSYSINELERYTIGKDYYKEIFSYYVYSLDEIDLSEKRNSVSLFIDYLKMYYQEEYESIDVTVFSDIEQEDNSYIFMITLDFIDSDGNELYGYSSSSGKEIIKYSFNDDYLKVSYNTEIKYEFNQKIYDSDDSGQIAIQISQGGSTNYLFLTEYNNENCPTINNKDDFEDKGYVSIDVEYYIDGHYVFNSLSNPNYKEEVSQLSIYGYTDCFKNDMVWYLDPECTIPFNDDTWPCYSLNLYTTLDSLNDNYYFVAHTSFYEGEYEEAVEQNELYYYYDIMKNDEASEFIDFIYAYFNDKKIYSKDEIVFEEGKINYLILILEEENYI